jgi:tRNA threonylcarbamoyl adenosine modification protein (Sua5/YciO/YrdC/YwlC family)
MIFVINRENPQKRLIDKAVEILVQGGVIVYPTDTVYAFGCDMNDKRAVERIYRLKKIDRKKPLSFIFPDISSINDYVRNISDTAFKIMKKATPGPYTFIYNASKLVPNIVTTKQKTIGVRIPGNAIALDLVRKLERPVLSASINTGEGEYIFDPQEIGKTVRNEVDLIIDGGPIVPEPSTVVDFTGNRPEIIREGKGEIFF